MRTSKVERPTSNVEPSADRKIAFHFEVRRWKFEVRRSDFFTGTLKVER
jgi:hypothetical protein